MLKKVTLPITFLFLLALDRFTKALVQQNQNLLNSKLLKLTYSQNNSLFFFNIPLLVLITISIIGLILITIWLRDAYQQKEKLLIIALLLIITGGISNFYDRLFTGFVIDWIWTALLPISIFNFADIYITLGVTLAILSQFSLTKKTKSKT